MFQQHLTNYWEPLNKLHNTCLIRKADISWPCSTTSGICLANYFVTIRGSVVYQTSNDCDVVCMGPATPGELNLEGWNELAISSNSLKCQWPFGALSMPFTKYLFSIFIDSTNLQKDRTWVQLLRKQLDGNELIILNCVQLDLDIRHWLRFKLLQTSKQI